MPQHMQYQIFRSGKLLSNLGVALLQLFKNNLKPILKEYYYDVFGLHCCSTGFNLVKFNPFS